MPGLGTTAAAASPAKPTKRACDSCHSRKVKCDGQEPCDRCTKSDFICSFLNPVLPKGPIPRLGRKRPKSQKSAFIRTSRSSSPVRLPRQDPFDSWIDNTWQGSDITLQANSTPGWTVQDWQKDVPDTTSLVLEGLWDEICAETANKCPPLSEDLSGAADTSLLESALPPVLDPLDANSVIPDNALEEIPPQQDPVDFDDGNFLSLFPQNALMTNKTNTQPFTYNNFSILGGPATVAPIIPSYLPFYPPEDVSPVLTLTLDTLIKPQLEIFFERIYPMMPIFSPTFIFGRLSDVEAHQNRTFVALILAMCSLSLIHPLKPDEVPQRTTRAKQSKTLMDEVLRLRSKWDWSSQASVESATTSYMLFGTMFELGHAEGARLRLKEAIGIGELLKLDDIRTYVGIEADEARRRMRLFWVLGITERAYALQRFGTITFHGALHTPSFKSLIPTQDLPSRTLLHLAKLFSFVDSDIISCWNGRCNAATCTSLTKERVVTILRSLGGTPAQVFGSDIALTGLSDVQQADLLITWQWLRNRIWRLAAGHGLTEDESSKELGLGYVVDVASATVLICRRLNVEALEAHGCGFVEKLYDIASIVTDLLQTSTTLRSDLVDIAKLDRWTDLLQTLYNYVASHRSGMAFVQPMAQALSVANEVKLLAACSS
ncbi:uncharacterized protein I303_106363 [Kwoniella dejecticola CBS 10117]|uniref:Zn(2)-C6 fungal-type domain-containing protein n=1 Tax=Kwoniella dejecticola CBS 10117 TaxID=1296121 RepID=A0A1A5ZUX8_9TREE|nr:uncharacterized protein I303_08380 [Kwoniella dejecticola CBS 10117]OBR81609.1 hypothetical protein I303_08380 [Kwoniella dejecticola CBS 10117]